MQRKILTGAAAMILAASMAPATVQAQEMGNLFQRMFGTSQDQPEINYSERAPLVIPNDKQGMREPGTARNAAQDPNWPNDPDEKRRKAAGRPRNSRGPNDVTLRPEEMAAGQLRGPSRDQSDPMTYGGDPAKRAAIPLKPRELQKKLDFGPNADNTPLVAGQEEPRRSLIDPPAGYRTPLASAPLTGNEPLPSEAEENQPWYKRMWRTPKSR